MKNSNSLHNSERWKETLEEWTPDIEATGWEDVAKRIPSGKAFGVRQRIEGGTVRAIRSVARFVSLKMAIVAIASAAISGYVTYRIVEKHTVERIVVKEYVMLPAASQQAALQATSRIGDEKYDRAEMDMPQAASYLQPAGADSSDRELGASSADARGIGSAVNSGSSSAVSYRRAGSVAGSRLAAHSTSINSMGATANFGSTSARKDGIAGAAAGNHMGAHSTNADIVGSDTRSDNADVVEDGKSSVAASSGSPSEASPTRSSSAAASISGAAISGHAAASSSGAKAARHKGGGSKIQHSSSKSSAYTKSQASAGASALASASEMEAADAVSGRQWIKKRRIAKSTRGSALKHRTPASADSWSGSDAASTVPSNPASDGSFAKRELPEGPIARGNASLQKFHLNPSWSTGSSLTLEYPAVHVPFMRYLSYFWGVSLDAGAARSGSSTLVFAGANAFVGSMYKEKVGLMLSVGGRWLGDLPSTLQVDSNSDVSIPEIDPDSSKRSRSLQSYYQAIFGLDGVVRLYSGSKASLSTTLGARGCWTQRVKGDSTSKRVIPLSAVRFSASYRRKTSAGNISLSPFVEYQLNGAGPLAKSSFLYGINVGVVF
jgi:hypothetical protein